jgi:4-amino-4-deoxy-L-arabinose transferase-like glycosyltransferase
MGCVILLFGLFAQLLSSASVKSPTVDEPNHLTRGYAYLKTGKLRFTATSGHPPLFNILSALPLTLFAEIGSPENYAGWEGGFINAYAVAFVFDNPVPLERLFFVGRLPTMFVALCLAALVARWANELYGPWGSVVALTLCAFDPNLIAHGRLVTTDVGVTFFFALAVYAFWRFLRQPSVAALVFAGLALGVAQCVKFSAILLFPVIVLMGLIEISNRSSRLRLPRRFGIVGQRWLSAFWGLLGALTIMMLLAGLTIWAVYRFEIRAPSGWTLPMPAPVYVEGLQAAMTRVSSGSPTFLLGHRMSAGRWYYFIVALALKTPVPTWIIVLLSLISMIWQRVSRVELSLWIAALAYFAVSVRNPLNLGYRHLLPIWPFLWVYAGRLGGLVQAWLDAGAGESYRKWGRAAVAGAVFLGMWLAVGALGVWPDYLAYFNMVAGGPDAGWRYLVDSNLDWGQDLYALKKHVDDHSDDVPIYLSWFGCTYPYLYDLGLQYRHLPGQLSYPYPSGTARSSYNPLYPSPGLYAISATNLQGLWLADGDVFARFRSQEPVGNVGHSILIYKVAASSEQASPTCISGMGLGELGGETISRSLGRGPGWVKWFDHRTSFILPGQGDVVYVLPSMPLGFAPDWQESFRVRASAIHAQIAPQPATVYQLDRMSADAMLSDVLLHSRSGDPVTFDHGLELLGYRLLSSEEVGPGEAVEFATVWQVTAEMPPSAGDLQMFAHLLDAEGQWLAGDDRLDLEPLTWQPGDLLIQYHRVNVSEDIATGEYHVAVGLYVRHTMQRLAVLDGGQSIADHVLLQSVVVTESE